MSSQSHLDAEELENVALVRMEDVQPDRSSEKAALICKQDIESDSDSHSIKDENLHTFVEDGSEFLCVMDDENSNIGSMVSIKSEELIVPEVLESAEEFEVPAVQCESPPLLQNIKDPILPKILTKPSPQDQWPTLEILPGGVINLAEKTDYGTDSIVDKDTSEVSEMIYACAKCSQTFKYLFCLVKHVRWHELQSQMEKLPDTKLTPIEKKMADLQRKGKEMDKILNTKLTPIEKKMADLQRRGKEIDKIIKTQKEIVEVKTEPKEKIAKQAKEKYICLHSGKRKIVQKPKIRKAPKKS